MNGHIATAELESVGAYGQSRFHGEDKLAKENADDYERRTWRLRTHANEEGNIFIPPMSFKNSLADAARFLSLQIPGQGKATYTKHFLSGIMVNEPLVLPIKRDDVAGTWLHLNADGKRGGGTRVMRCMPTIPKWSGTVKYYIMDEVITKDVFRQVLEESGKLIGIGYFRPQNGGYWGRFTVKSLKWE